MSSRLRVIMPIEIHDPSPRSQTSGSFQTQKTEAKEVTNPQEEESSNATAKIQCVYLLHFPQKRYTIIQLRKYILGKKGYPNIIRVVDLN